MGFTKRQIEIIHASTELINDGGIQNLTIKSLAEKMNFSEPALYRHFTNKSDILSSILNYFASQLSSKLEKIQKSRINGLEKLQRLIEIQFEHFSKQPAVVMVIFAETSFQYEEKLSEAVLNILQTKKEGVIRIIELGQEDGSIRTDLKSEQLASIFMGSMRFTVLQWRLKAYSSDLKNEGFLLWTTLEKLISSSIVSVC